jgi:hypothetical protein
MRRTISVVTISLLTLGVCYALSLLPKKPVAKAQGTETCNIRIEDFPKAYKNKEPVKIIGLYLGIESIQSGEDFQADKDWLRDLQIMVKNVSDQPIREVILNLDLPTTDLPMTDPNYAVERIEIRYGRDYWYLRDPDTRVPEVLIPPGGIARFSYNANFSDAYDVLVKNLRMQRKILPSRGYVSLEAVVFDDIDIGWTRTKYVVRTGPASWIVDPAKAQTSLNLTPLVPNTFASCYNTPSEEPLANAVACTTPCSDCKYIEPILIQSPGNGWRRQLVSRQCYHLVFGNPNPNDPCSCSQPNVFHINFFLEC